MSNHDKIREESNNISKACVGLERISDSLFAVGLDKLSQSIHSLAEAIQFSVDTIMSTNGKIIDENYKAQQQSSLNVLNAALSGIAIKQIEQDRT